MAGALIPGRALAQACLGGPGDEGEFTIGIGATVSDGDPGAFLQGRANLDGPIAFSSMIGVAEKGSDPRAFVVGGTLVYELPGPLSPCAVGGFGHSTWKGSAEGEEWNASVLSFPAGVAVGGRLGTPGSTEIFPWSQLGALYSRVRRSPRDGGSGEATATDTEFGVFAAGGLGVQLGSFFLRAGAFVATVDDPAPSFTLEVGWLRRRILMANE